MKSFVFSLLFFFLLSPVLSAQPPSEPSLGSAPSEWPGVSFAVTNILRLDPGHILVAVRIRGDATAKNPTLIGLAKPTAEIPGNIEPFSLLPAKLIDQATGKEYATDEKLPPEPYWGDPQIISNIRPGTWFQLAVKFEAPPPPPPGPDGTVLPLKITIVLPRAAAPIKDLLLPSDTAQRP